MAAQHARGLRRPQQRDGSCDVVFIEAAGILNRFANFNRRRKIANAVRNLTGFIGATAS